jgi:vacuolar-type H+-ATPase subunit H
MTVWDTLVQIRTLDAQIKKINEETDKRVEAARAAVQPTIDELERRLRELQSELQSLQTELSQARNKKEQAINRLQYGKRSTYRLHCERRDLFNAMEARVKGLLLQLHAVVPEWGDLSLDMDSCEFSFMDYSDFRIDWELEGSDPHVILANKWSPQQVTIIPLAWLDMPFQEVVEIVRAQLAAQEAEALAKEEAEKALRAQSLKDLRDRLEQEERAEYERLRAKYDSQ